MSVQSVSSSTNPYLSATQASSSNLRSDFNNLITAIQSGDLKSAQTDFSQIQSAMQSVQGTQSNGSQQSQFSTDLAAVGSALQSGNISGAQDALKKLGQDMQSAGKAHHHHHHHHGGAAQSSTTASTNGVTAPLGSNSSSGSSVNLLV
jgi:ribosomal protein S20